MTILRTLITTTVLSEKKIPTAVVKGTPDFGIIGSVVRLDGRLSTDPDEQPLTYAWSFESVPIGSGVVGEGFRELDPDGSVVSFSPDIVGEYVVNLVVSNGMFESPKGQQVISIRAILVPHAQGIVPDGKWLWSYIRDVWQGVDNKEMFESLWSALIQIAGSELLKLYQTDYNKSIRDIQDLYQRRWLSYEPRLEIIVNGPDFFLGNHYAGVNASTVNLGLSGTLIIMGGTELVVIEGSVLQGVAGQTLDILSSRDSENIGTYLVAGQNAAKNGYKLALTDPVPDTTADQIATDAQFYFSALSTRWTVVNPHRKNYVELMMENGSPLDYLLPIQLRTIQTTLDGIQVGDVIQYKTGPNKGFYRITEKGNTYVIVDKTPPVASTSLSPYLADIYRPVRFSITQPDNLLTDTISLPYDVSQDTSILAAGRVIIVNGQTYTIVRSSLDTKQRVPSVVITVDRALLQSGLTGLSWRSPPTLVSTTQDFEEDGVSPGDVLFFSIVQTGGSSVSIPLQVLGVDRGRLGFVPTDQPVTAGQVPEIPNQTYLDIAQAFGIDGVTENSDGSLSFSGTAAQYLASVNSQRFKASYWNTQLTPTTDISVNPTFQLKPGYIVRNRLIPVDDTLRSVPLLQSFIVQPEVIERDGKFYQQHKGQEFELDGPPLLLRENIDYIIDGQIAFEGKMTFETGTDIIDVDGADFVDRGIGPGDQFIIQEPITLERTYYVQAVLSATKLKLTREVPLYALDELVTAKVQIVRRREGHYIRFTPGQFTCAAPAPDRLWGEVSFFDNNENIENNFGILVGLTRDDIARVSSDLNYRQAVSGIMYAYLKGSALEKIRLGAQILLGLPFAENRGVIRSIETDYRLDISGDPILGRLLIEDVDNLGAPLGTLRVYTYPIDPVSILAGLEISPVTGLEYAVGDIVEKFAALSKGVEVSDYLSNPSTSLSVERYLQQFHSMRLRVNDNLFTLAEIGLVSTFLRKITPAYIAFYISILSEFSDDVDITDVLASRLHIGAGVLVDNASMNLPPTFMLDSRNVSGIPQIALDDGMYWVRRSGTDLVSTQTSNTVTIPSAGVVSPRANEDFEAPLTVIEDRLLLLSGDDADIYDITGVTDTTITIDGPAFGLQDGTGLRYAILRKVKTLIREGTASMTNGNPLVTFTTGGLRTEGVSPGDYLLNVFSVGTPSRFTITEVLESTPSSGVYDRIRVTPTPNATSTTTFFIARSRVFESPFPEAFDITGAGAGLVTTVPGVRGSTLWESGDELYVQSGAFEGTTYTVVDAERKYITPTLAPASIREVKLIKKNRAGLGVNWDAIPLFDPTDIVDVAISESQALADCTATSKIVTLETERTTAPASGPTALDPTDLFIRPGDFLTLEGGVNGAVDIGYGPGVYVIAQVTSADVRLSVALTATESLPWSITRRR